MVLVMPKWEVRGLSLGIKFPGGEFRIPRASQIYASIFTGKPLPGEFEGVDSLQSELTEIRFSRIGTCIELHFTRSDKGVVRCSAITNKGGRYYDVTSQLVDGVDHAVCDNNWIYLTENFEQARSFVSECGISDVSKVSYASYLKALRKAPECPSVPVKSEVHLGDSVAHESSKTELPAALKAKLYPYQEDGFFWLKFVTDENCGCILGDEMGLGKTLQVITLLLDRCGVGTGPSLVVAPVSLLENWRREIIKFAPSLRVLVHHGPRRTGSYKELLSYDVVVVSYSAITTDSSLLCSVNWDLLVADEAQNIKSPYASRTKYIKIIPRRSTIAVSGTPFENHMSDIWSVVDFVLPNFLGKLADFKREYPDTIEGADKIEPLLSPLMIRRLVKDVAKDLPKKVEIPVPLVMTAEEATIYEGERNRIVSSINSDNTMFAELSGLRMHCTHPSLTSAKWGIDPLGCCTKYSRLCEILSEIKSQYEKVILFTSFTGMCDLLAKDIPNRLGIPVSVINGSTPAVTRQPIVDAFSALPGCALLVLNPRAAATGLNITAANHVIHYNLEWNPALEDQASARAYRRGQSKTVFVHRLFYVNTVEEFVNDKIRSKRALTAAAVVGNIGDSTSRQDYLDALAYSTLKEGV